MRSDPHTISLRPTPPPEPSPAPPAPQPRRPRRRSALKEYIVYLVVMALLGGGVYAWFSWDDWFSNDSLDRPASTDEASEVNEEIGDIVKRVGELIVLPENETPTIATVTDPAKLRDQVFFANAKEGDVVLIYTAAQKAYLYDPKQHKLIEVAPLTIQ